ncbi:DMT family transporter [Leifsonia aquatica]|uniref:Drug/metabolite transporter (DMT)-like permease n=2 Tax=Leifsonia aquatica TaxID=144185 RepID=A0A7W4YLD9_LEIAQ|nr:DMT family transporter [Leifsonia aquatica]ERK69992.1 putative membrane protein [Leifsonia aquatica ATCC 14665]MBB2968589.1 drug/metabolite transporter (DMT)-like permease [Leifsonia aquatica]
MPAVALGLLSAIVYGSADFVGGVAARRIGALRVTAVGAVSGLVLLFLSLPLVGGAWTPAAIGWGALSGVIGSVAVFLLYACLAIGPMSILSPLTAVISAIVPLTWGLIGGDRFAPIGYVALGVALIAVVLVGFVPERGAVRPSGRALLMAVGAGVFIGAFLILLDQTPADSGVVPLIANRAVNGAIMWTVVGLVLLRARTRAPGGDRFTAPGAGLAAASGVLDASANVLILIGLRAGDLSTMSVLVALYPAGTILLAAIVLRERIAPVQWIGLALAIGAAGMLAAA